MAKKIASKPTPVVIRTTAQPAPPFWPCYPKPALARICYSKATSALHTSKPFGYLTIRAIAGQGADISRGGGGPWRLAIG